MPPTLDGRGTVGRSVGRSVDRCYTYVYCEEKKRGEESKGAASVASRMRRAGEGRERGKERGATDDEVAAAAMSKGR